MAGTLYLIPTPLGALGEHPSLLANSLPTTAIAVIQPLSYFIVENSKSARAFLKAVGTHTPLQSLDLRELNEHTPEASIKDLLQPLLAGHDVGLLSDAGCPAIADPGAPLVRLAHQQGIRVKPLVGPSSLVLALMGSGLIGQRFAFHGYLPAKPEARRSALRELELRSERDDAAQIFIETPYRNGAMLETLQESCRPDTWCTIACDLTLASEWLRTRCLADIMNPLPDLNKRPCVFILYRQGRPRPR